MIASEPTAALTARYRLDRTEEWGLLLRRLRVRDRFAFLPVFAPEDAGVEIARRALESWLEENGGRLITINLQSGGPSDSLTRALIDLPGDAKSVHWIQAAPLDSTGEKEAQLAARWHEPVANLNSRRNELQRALYAPLIFAGPEELSPYLRDHAPDLWDIRGGAHYLQPPEAESNLGGFSRYYGDFDIPGDPDFTLSLAKELEGQTERAEERASLISRAGRQAVHNGDFLRAEELLRESLRISREIGSGPEILWQREENLSRVLQKMAYSKEALVHGEVALAAAELAYGADSSEAGSVLNNLGVILASLAKPIRAELAYRRSIKIGEAELGGDHPQIATRLGNLAHLFETQGRPAEAESLLRRSLNINEAILGKDHPVTAACLNNLAQLFERQGKLTDAEKLLKRAINILGGFNGQDHPALAVALNNLGEIYRAQGRLAEAEPVLRRALAISEVVSGHEHPDTGIRLNNLANLLGNMGSPEEAEEYSRRHLTIFFNYRKRNGVPFSHEQMAVDNYTETLKAIGNTPAEVAVKIQDLKREVGLKE